MQERNEELKYASRMKLIGETTSAFKWFVTLLFTYLSVDTVAGKSTFFSAIIQFTGNLGIGPKIHLLVTLGLGGYGGLMTWLYRRKIKHNSKYIESLEQQFNKQRQSSHLTEKGHSSKEF